MQSLKERSLRNLGNSDIAITRIGFGGWAIGGDGWEYSFGPQDDRESIAAIHCALDLGINWVDTAAVYGLGHSEEVLARAIGTSGRKAFVFTKGGVRWRRACSLYNSLKAASLKQEVENSLRRLGVEAIDLYQVHWPEPDCEIEEGWETLARLREQGKIRWIGVSNFSVAQMKRAQKIAPITSSQPHYSLLSRGFEREKLAFIKANGIGVINYSPMGSGLLTGEMTAESIAALPVGDWRRHHPQYQWPLLERNLRLVELLREIGSAHGVSPGVVAVAWTLHQPAITGAIVGLRSVREVEEIAPALDFKLSQDEYDRIGAVLSSFGWHFARLLRRISPESWLANLSEHGQKRAHRRSDTLRNVRSSD